MTDPKNHSPETAIAVLVTENKHTREKLDSIEDKLDRIAAKLDSKTDLETVQALMAQKADKTEVEGLKRQVKILIGILVALAMPVVTGIGTIFWKLISTSGAS